MKLIPLAPNAKVPIPGVSWKSLVSDDPADHQRWIAEGNNVGCPLRENGCSVADFDDKAAAREFWKMHVGKDIFNVVVETRRGAHFYFTGTTRTRKFEHGDMKGNGYCVFPPSVVDGWTYRFLPGYKWSEPLPFPEHLFQAERVPQITRTEIHDVTAYLAKVESIQGEHGSGGLVRAAAICRDAGLSEAEATVKLLWWNTLPVVWPAWSATEIARAVTNTYRKASVAQ